MKLLPRFDHRLFFASENSISFQGKYEIVKLLLKHGADATKKNRDGHTPLDLVKVTFLFHVAFCRQRSAMYFLGKLGTENFFNLPVIYFDKDH